VRLYFASPNTRILAEAVKDKHVLESFAIQWKNANQYRMTYKSMMLDSGAFSAHNSGKVIDVDEYGEYAAVHAADYDLIVNLDDIGGDVGKSEAHERRLREVHGLNPVPVFHQGEPWAVLDEYASRAEVVGLGFKRPLTPPAIREAWIGECFSRLPQGQRVHGFAMTSFMGKFPFASVDSTTWIREYMNITYGPHARIGQLAAFLTPLEILDLVIKRWERLPRCTTWPRLTHRDKAGQMSLV
tara:strand:+ start:32 stop:757 length:726 start_codon:yes stop_codon:yes gene_type:complete